MEIKGTLKQVHPVIERNNFKSQKVWIDTADKPEFPQTVEVEVNQAGCGKFDGIAIGAPLTLHLNLRGRTWTGTDGVEKCFNTLVCWKVEAHGASPFKQAAPATAPAQAVGNNIDLPNPDDLPF